MELQRSMSERSAMETCNLCSQKKRPGSQQDVCSAPTHCGPVSVKLSIGHGIRTRHCFTTSATTSGMPAR